MSSTGQHALKILTKREYLGLGFAHRAKCRCGWNSGPLWITIKSARRAYYRHKVAST